MTATPHVGSEANFQAFLTLLDKDRYVGQYRAGHHKVNTDGVMRRMVKEELLTFDGKLLFPDVSPLTGTAALGRSDPFVAQATRQCGTTDLTRAACAAWRSANSGGRRNEG
ncbi:MAG: hypothetical protein ACR2KG_10175 [Nocardioidaceae bacterium]